MASATGRSLKANHTRKSFSAQPNTRSCFVEKFHIARSASGLLLCHRYRPTLLMDHPSFLAEELPPPTAVGLNPEEAPNREPE